MWCRFAPDGYETIRIPETLAFYRHHSAAKGNVMVGRMWSELAALALSYGMMVYQSKRD